MTVLLLSIVALLLIDVEAQGRLVEFGPHHREWVDQQTFIDVTDYPYVDTSTTPVVDNPYPNGPQHKELVDALLP